MVKLAGFWLGRDVIVTPVAPYQRGGAGPLLVSFSLTSVLI